MIEIAREKMPEADLIQYDFAGGLPKSLEGIRFDWIISTYAVHHLTDEQKKVFMNDLIKHINPDGAVIFGDVAFRTQGELAHARIKAQDEWDDEEYYIVFDEFKKGLPELELKFEKKSFCSGVLTIKK